MKIDSIPKWIWAVAALVLLAQGGTMLLMFAGLLQGSARNIVPQSLVGGALALAILAAYIVRNHAGAVPAAPARVALFLLTLFVLALTGLHFRSMRPLLALPYDLACWSEPMFIADVLKWKAGLPLYLSPEDSNSGMYSFGAPTLTYFLAKMVGRGESIVAYRWIQQLFLALAALFATATAWRILRIAAPERVKKISPVWWAFFFLSCFLFTTNSQTGAFNTFLHNDPLALMVAALSFFALAGYAESGRPRWLWFMAALPMIGFLAKQFLAIFAGVYVVYLWLEGKSSWRRILAFGAVTFGILAIGVAAGFALWGENFRYWVFTIMSQHVVSFANIVKRFSDAALFLLPGLLGGLYFVRGENFQRLLGLWCGWLVMVVGGLYTSGVTYSPTHFGPASLIGFSFFLAALALLWPDSTVSVLPPAQQWYQLGVGVIGVLALYGAFGFMEPERFPVTPDLKRYVSAIEQEFEGQPPERVLLDTGDWIYFRHGVLAKDRMPILVTHRKPHYGLLERVRNQQYTRILVRVYPNGKYSFDIGAERGIREAILAYYREVRRIPGYERENVWRFGEMTFGETIVLEPIPQEGKK